MLYNFKHKDPILDVLRTLIETRAGLDGETFGKTMRAIERETYGEISYSTMYGWFTGKTRYPRYCTVARLYLAICVYARKPVTIGQTVVGVLHSVPKRRKAA